MSLIMFIIICSFAIRLSECDTNSSQDDDRAILKGTQAREGQFPFVVYVHLGSKKYGTYVGRGCTGSILTKVWVLTASHCFKVFFDEDPKYEFEDIRGEIRGGTVDFNKNLPNRQIRLAGRVLRIPTNKDNKLNKAYNNDIAIIEVTEEFEFNAYVGPVSLAKRPLPHDKERKCLVIGFGHFEKPPEKSVLTNSILHYTYMTLPAEEFECRRLAELNRRNYPLKDWDGSQICIHPITWDKAPCRGDSGGPLICNHLQVGASTGRENVDPKYTGRVQCGLEGNYHVYAFPGWHEAWLREHIPELPAFKYLGSPTMRSSNVSISNSASVNGGTAQTVCILLHVWMILPENM